MLDCESELKKNQSPPVTASIVLLRAKANEKDTAASKEKRGGQRIL